MRKILILLLFNLFFVFNINAQTKSIPIEGKCYEIIQGLRDYYKNDTLAINHFRDFYIVHQMSISTTSELNKKGINEIIHFFSEPIRKNSCICSMKGWRERNVLLDNRPDKK